MRVSLASEADAELSEGARFYLSAAGAELSEAFLLEFERTVALLRSHPGVGTVWNGVVRRFPLHRFPYSIVFRVLNEELRILAIAHHSRRPGYWIDRI